MSTVPQPASTSEMTRQIDAASLMVSRPENPLIGHGYREGAPRPIGVYPIGSQAPCAGSSLIDEWLQYIVWLPPISETVARITRRSLAPSVTLYKSTSLEDAMSPRMMSSTPGLNRTLVAAAAMLGLSRKGLYLKRQRYGIDPPEPSHHADTN